VVYYSVTGHRHFHHAHAKNIAHRLARGEIVCNLDADNFTGFGFAQYLIDAFSSGKSIMVRSPGGLNGTFGRIAMRKMDFEAIGGYDERMDYGWGYEDTDLIKRAIMAGMEEHYIPPTNGFLTAIEHDDLERTQYNRIKIFRHFSRQCHKSLSLETLSRGGFVANAGKLWGKARAIRNFADIVEI
jgi:hypothetical protein